MSIAIRLADLLDMSDVNNPDYTAALQYINTLDNNLKKLTSTISSAPIEKLVEQQLNLAEAMRRVADASMKENQNTEDGVKALSAATVILQKYKAEIDNLIGVRTKVISLDKENANAVDELTAKIAEQVKMISELNGTDAKSVETRKAAIEMAISMAKGIDSLTSSISSQSDALKKNEASVREMKEALKALQTSQEQFNKEERETNAIAIKQAELIKVLTVSISDYQKSLNGVYQINKMLNEQKLRMIELDKMEAEEQQVLSELIDEQASSNQMLLDSMVKVSIEQEKLAAREDAYNTKLMKDMLARTEANDEFQARDTEQSEARLEKLAAQEDAYNTKLIKDMLARQKANDQFQVRDTEQSEARLARMEKNAAKEIEANQKINQSILQRTFSAQNIESVFSRMGLRMLASLFYWYLIIEAATTLWTWLTKDSDAAEKLKTDLEQIDVSKMVASQGDIENLNVAFKIISDTNIAYSERLNTLNKMVSTYGDLTNGLTLENSLANDGLAIQEKIRDVIIQQGMAKAYQEKGERIQKEILDKELEYAKPDKWYNPSLIPDVSDINYEDYFKSNPSNSAVGEKEFIDNYIKSKPQFTSGLSPQNAETQRKRIYDFIDARISTLFHSIVQRDSMYNSFENTSLSVDEKIHGGKNGKTLDDYKSDLANDEKTLSSMKINAGIVEGKTSQAETYKIIHNLEQNNKDYKELAEKINILKKQIKVLEGGDLPKGSHAHGRNQLDDALREQEATYREQLATRQDAYNSRGDLNSWDDDAQLAKDKMAMAQKNYDAKISIINAWHGRVKESETQFNIQRKDAAKENIKTQSDEENELTRISNARNKRLEEAIKANDEYLQKVRDLNSQLEKLTNENQEKNQQNKNKESKAKQFSWFNAIFGGDGSNGDDFKNKVKEADQKISDAKTSVKSAITSSSIADDKLSSSQNDLELLGKGIKGDTPEEKEANDFSGLYKIKDQEVKSNSLDSDKKRNEAVKSQTDLAQAESDKKLLIAQHERDAKNQMAQQVYEYSAKLANQGFENMKNNLQNQMGYLEKNSQLEMTLAGNNTAAKSRIAIEEAERMKSLRRQEAQVDKEQAIFNAGISMLSGIAADLKLGMPAAIPMIALTTALGLAQIGAITSKPLPNYFKGRKGGQKEVARINEEGFELVESNSGKFKILGGGKETITLLEQGDTVHTHKESANFLQSLLKGTGVVLDRDKRQNKEIAVNMLSKSEMKEALSSALKENPLKVENHYPAKGVEERLQRVQSRNGI